MAAFCLGLNVLNSSLVVPQIAKFMGPTWGPPVGPRWAHVGPMNLAIRVILWFVTLEALQSSTNSWTTFGRFPNDITNITFKMDDLAENMLTNSFLSCVESRECPIWQSIRSVPIIFASASLVHTTSAIIRLSNLPWYYIHHCNNSSRTQNRLSTNISHPHDWAMGCLL